MQMPWEPSSGAQAKNLLEDEKVKKACLGS